MPWIAQLQAANWSLASAISLGAYALGCFTTGYYLVRVWMGLDIRTMGSGNAGARNVSRFLGPFGFLITLAGDFGKGAFVIWAARHFTTDDRLVALAMLAVVVGHIWPIQLRLRGGKGMATSLGALLVYDFHLAFAFVVLFVCAWPFFRKTTLPGLLAFASLPLVCLFMDYEHAKSMAIFCLAALVLLAHRKNLMEEIGHLLDRREVHPKHTPPEL
jgi:acyl phosphate:glycerol-3-phosphate acyltransferase